MCRHLAYLGPPVRLRELLCDPPHSLYRQAWAPRRQRYGVVNADGFGVGWYADGDPVPARYRRAGPMWADATFADIARVTRAGAVLAAVRSATEGTAQDASAAAPYGWGPYLFSHNGAAGGWPTRMAELAAELPPALLLELESRTDSALLWAFVRDRLTAGDTPAAALRATVGRAAAHAPGRYNLLLTDAGSIVATTYGDTLCYRATRDSVVVASEPHDEGPGWVDVPDRHLLVARPGDVTVHPMEEP